MLARHLVNAYETSKLYVISGYTRYAPIYMRFKFVLFADQITVNGNYMSV